jgi:hypothetical protein
MRLEPLKVLSQKLIEPHYVSSLSIATSVVKIVFFVV